MMDIEERFEVTGRRCWWLRACIASGEHQAQSESVESGSRAESRLEQTGADGIGSRRGWPRGRNMASVDD